MSKSNLKTIYYFEIILSISSYNVLNFHNYFICSRITIYIVEFKKIFQMEIT